MNKNLIDLEIMINLEDIDQFQFSLIKLCSKSFEKLESLKLNFEGNGQFDFTDFVGFLQTSQTLKHFELKITRNDQVLSS